MMSYVCVGLLSPIIIQLTRKRDNTAMQNNKNIKHKDIITHIVNDQNVCRTSGEKNKEKQKMVDIEKKQ